MIPSLHFYADTAKDAIGSRKRQANNDESSEADDDCTKNNRINIIICKC